MFARSDGSSSVRVQYWYFSGSHSHQCHDGLAPPTWLRNDPGEMGVDNLGQSQLPVLCCARAYSRPQSSRDILNMHLWRRLGGKNAPGAVGVSMANYSSALLHRVIMTFQLHLSSPDFAIVRYTA